MISQKLIDYVKETHKKGFSYEEVAIALSRAHYTKFEIDEAVRFAKEEETLPPILESHAMHHRINRRIFAFGIGTFMLVLIIFSLFLFTDFRSIAPIDFIDSSKFYVESPAEVQAEEAFCSNAKIDFFMVDNSPKICYQNKQPVKTLQVMLRNKGKVTIESLEFTIESAERKSVIQLANVDFKPEILLAKQIELKANFDTIQKVTVVPMLRINNNLIKCSERTIAVSNIIFC